MTVLTPQEVQQGQKQVLAILESLQERILGQENLLQMVVVACLARGNVLLEGLPGLGKTELVKGLAGTLGLEFRRIQFTPDLLPSDITGSAVLEEEDGRRIMRFQPGPLFGNVILADEINRASPRTQSALLEAMQEQRVTVLGKTHELPKPFWCMATQNPIDMEGTYPLPEAQLDRFLFKLIVTGVSTAVLETIISSRRRGKAPDAKALFSSTEYNSLFDTVDRVFLSQPVANYIARLVNATHPTQSESPELVKQYVRYGASPRAAIGLAEAGRACALMEGRPIVGFSDIEKIAPHVLGHRIAIDYRAKIDGVDLDKILASIFDSIRPDKDSITEG